MIQRIQSVYLLLSMVVLSLMFFFPMASVDVRGTEIEVWTSHYGSGFVMSATNYWFVMFSVLISALIALQAIALFSYKKRKRQLMCCRIAFLFTVTLLVLLLIGLDSIAAHIEPANDMSKNIVQYEWAVFMPMLSLLFLSMAQRGIRKDEALIRSADRLR